MFVHYKPNLTTLATSSGFKRFWRFANLRIVAIRKTFRSFNLVSYIFNLPTKWMHLVDTICTAQVCYIWQHWSQVSMSMSSMSSWQKMFLPLLEEGQQQQFSLQGHWLGRQFAAFFGGWSWEENSRLNAFNCPMSFLHKKEFLNGV